MGVVTRGVRRRAAQRVAVAAAVVVGALTAGAAGLATAAGGATAVASAPAPLHWGAFFGEPAGAPVDVVRAPRPVSLPGPVAQVATSNAAGYALLADGTVWAWGLGGGGELGEGSTADSLSVAVQVRFPAGVTIARLPTDAMPYDTGLAVDTAGRAWGWGLDAMGQLCLGDTTRYLTPVPLPLTGVTALAGAGDHALYDTHGTVVGCGGNHAGDLGDGSEIPSSTPVAVAALAGRPVRTLVASFQDSGALLTDGTYLNWGLDGQGQLGDGRSGVDSAVPVTVPLPRPVTQVAQGGSQPRNGQTLVELSDGTFRGWGDDQYGQLGDGGSTDQASPVAFRLPAGVAYRALATGGATSYAVATTGDVYSWGWNTYGQAGDSTTRARRPPQRVAVGMSLISATANDVVVAPPPGPSTDAAATLTAATVPSGAPGAPGAAASGAPGPGANWPAYLNGPLHSSFDHGATAVDAADAAGLTPAWTWTPDPPAEPQLGEVLNSSPTVYGGVVYIGADNGYFYALNETTGAVLWKRFFGYTTQSTCKAAGFGSLGFVGTATVAPDPVSGATTVYIYAPDGYLYALQAATGATTWRSVVGIPSKTADDYMAWSSPTVADGKVYVGIASQCDNPLVRAGVRAYDQAGGSRLASFYNVPAGSVGGSVWSSVAVDGQGNVFETSGNGPYGNQLLGDSESIVELNGSTLHDEGPWQIPATQPTGPDSDFGGSPTLFRAVLPGSSRSTAMVGACNKDGIFYALRAHDLAAGPVWQDQVSTGPRGFDECIAAAAFNGSDLFVGGPDTTINGVKYLGGIRELDPATGDVLWATGLPGGVDGSPSLDGAGVLAVPTLQVSSAGSGVTVVAAADGAVLAELGNGTPADAEFAQPVFAGRFLFAATYGAGLTAYAAGSGAPPA